jgi:hypothetical protein
MPRSAWQLGAAERLVPLEGIAQVIVTCLVGGRSDAPPRPR